ncbi:hypothetical protein [Teredinibacter haidensis]|uniref:hypothetical protein n=1 Tax=Teredinibacter haidensis TaxID=2731755 RepID=UPI0009490404|nr:hypothetical protein [Teredinibacter haidensis]
MARTLALHPHRPQHDETKSDWKLWEADILVEYGLNHHFVTVYNPTSGDTSQSFIHGFDLKNSLILLDGLYPRPTKHLQSRNPLWLQIPCTHGFFNLQVSLVETDGYRGSELLTVKVLSTELSHNRRWNTRVYFDARQGPKVELQLDLQPIQTAFISNLSRKGALLEIYGKDIKNALNPKKVIRGLFCFNQQFQLSLEASVKQCRFLRTPCCHTQLRLQFNLPNDEQQAQLETFIDAIASPHSFGSFSSSNDQHKFAVA